MIISFSKDMCIGCGICVEGCVEGVLVNRGKKNTPEAVKPEKCIKCGHCVALCPSDAIVHHKMDMEQFIPIKKAVEITDDAMENFLGAKRSIRRFSDKVVEKEKIERLLKVGRMAPSDNNSQERDFIVLSDQNLIQHLENKIVESYKNLLFWMNPVMRKICSLFTPNLMRELEKVVLDFKGLIELAEKGEKPVFRGAPHVIFIYAPKGNIMAKDNCLASQDYMMIQAQTMGLGTCIIGYATGVPKVLAKFLKIPKNHKVFGAITVGYPKLTFKKTVARERGEVVWL
ncbi:MAG: nitroreductase family protein [Halanaerobiales bacterium]|nr:nitroreductase family protein [Halanaerobiales bacterium]